MPNDAPEPCWHASRDDRGIWTLSFDRPGSSHNTIGRGALHQLDEHLSAIGADPEARGLIVRSAKAKGFCAGADLKTIGNSASPAEVADFARLGQAVFGRLARLTVPKVALVHGVCLGGGLELALACGPIVALDSPDAPLSIGAPEVRLGLVPGWGAITALPERLGLEPALELLLQGKPIDIDQAVEIGLVERIDSDRRLDPASYPTSPPTAVDTSVWLDVIEQRLQSVSHQDDPGRQARLAVLEIIRTGLTAGVSTALAEAAGKLGELAFTPEARQAMAPFLGR